jgi:hypothetical protein
MIKPTWYYPQLYGLDDLITREEEIHDDEEITNQEDGNQELEASGSAHHHEGEIITSRRTSRPSQQSTRLRDFVTYGVSKKNKIKNYYEAQEPTNYYEAIKNPLWCKDMEQELRALKNNKT